jgi:glycosyltransferase involved in cell wall biosynthesis
MTPGVILLAPPWPRSGSGNLFAAQAALHVRRGARVFLLLTPLGRGFSRSKRELWNNAVSSMRYPGLAGVSYPRASRGRVRSYLQWLRAGRDDALAISARYGASGRLPADVAAFLSSARVDLVHANHVFSIPLAQRLAGLVHSLQGRRPRILLDTHDIQSDAFRVRQKKNPYSRRLDSREDLLRTELALCDQADALVHLTQADCDFFATHLPRKRNTLLLPTLDPATEAELIRRRGQRPPAGSGVVYIGNQHEANLVTVRWLLREVLPLARPAAAERVRIVGSIGGLLRRRDPDLFERHASLFLGEVPSVFDLYAEAQAVLAPAAAGTGTSIKLIEALCAGKPVLTTTLGLRGMPAGEMAGADIHVHDGPAEFAAALTGLADEADTAPSSSRLNAALYDRLFSNARYFEALDGLVGGPERARCGRSMISHSDESLGRLSSRAFEGADNRNARFASNLRSNSRVPGPCRG